MPCEKSAFFAINGSRIVSATFPVEDAVVQSGSKLWMLPTEAMFSVPPNRSSVAGVVAVAAAVVGVAEDGVAVGSVPLGVPLGVVAVAVGAWVVAVAVGSSSPPQAIDTATDAITTSIRMRNKRDLETIHYSSRTIYLARPCPG
jgi:hypothetical protein